MSKDYTVTLVGGKQKYVHRLITDAPAGMVVDHINGDGKDNRPQNLRVVKQVHNSRNRTKINSNNTSGYRGVTYVKRLGRWKAHIKVDRKLINLGYHDTPEEAAGIAITARLEYFGEFAGIV